MKTIESRSLLIDLLKGIAILSVILYHCGLLNYGYLGVDIFLVISGYLTTKGLFHAFEKNTFSYWFFLRKKIVRLWPLVIMITIVSFIGGYFCMLPVAFKNVCETAIGSSFFINNFVQYFVSSDYWDYSNDFKPLMHTWYIGLIMQFYVFYPLLFIIAKKTNLNFNNQVVLFISILFVLSLLLYISPGLTKAQKFYLLPARLFEFCYGGLIASKAFISGINHNKNTLLFLFVILLSFLCFHYDIPVGNYRLLLVTLFSGVLILFFNKNSLFTSNNILILSLVSFGASSYSLFLWHQVIFAFYRYVIDYNFTITIYIVLLLFAIIIGLLSYKFIEKPIDILIAHSTIRQNLLITSCLILALLITSSSGYYFMHKGVVRDVPELDIYKNSPTENHDYNNRVYNYNKDFPINGKKNILVIGDSYGRDWTNVLIESGLDTMMNISYRSNNDNILIKRIEKADFIFIANCVSVFKEYSSILPLLHHKKYWRIGVKDFGKGIGSIYNHNRHKEDYYKQTVQVSDKAKKINDEEKKIFGDRYINLMDIIQNKNGQTPAFTPTKKLISHDGLHLTKAGAQFYSSLIDVKYLLEEQHTQE